MSHQQQVASGSNVDRGRLTKFNRVDNKDIVIKLSNVSEFVVNSVMNVMRIRGLNFISKLNEFSSNWLDEKLVTRDVYGLPFVLIDEYLKDH